MGETFIQWVVENHFRDACPNLEAVGVEMVESVIPYEEAKIRILERVAQLHCLGGNLNWPAVYS